MQSIISLDLGGKNTGFFSFTSKDVLKIDNFQSGTIIYDENFVLSQVKRRGKRHTKRNNLRSKFVKRLFLLILQKHYGLDLKFLPDEILELFNKRGYTYASFELDDEKREKLESDQLREVLEDKFGAITQDSIERFLTDRASDENTFKEFEINFKKIIEDKKEEIKSIIENNLTNKSEFIVKYLATISYNAGLDNFTKKINKSLKDRSIESEYGKSKNEDLKKFIQGLIDVSDTEFLNDVKQIQTKCKDIIFEDNIRDGLDIVQDIIANHKKEIINGNLPRAKYFEEINAIIQTPKIITFFENHKLEIEDMKKLIGNLSNYQLKELRRYFNDEAMKDGDIWKSEKLHRVTWRFIQSWHPKNDEDKTRQKENLENLKEKSIIKFLISTNPIMTIPPYDDMNNRGAVKCQTLRLNEKYLDKHLPNWRDIAQKLASEEQKENLEASTVREYTTHSTLLHRILDTSSVIDPYKLRSDKIDGYADKLTYEDTENLQKFARDYYELIRTKVRTGIWTSSDDMLKKCNHNPPYKNNQIHNLVSGILGIKISFEQFTKFEAELWNAKFGNKKLSSYCKNIEELRKSYGNLFKSYIEELFKEGREDFTKEEQRDKKLLEPEVLNEWVKKIGDFLGIEEKYRARFNNHFSMAQLHTIIDTKRSGFNSTCKWCSSENQYRASTKIEINNETGEITTNANCQRLPADTQRPFSGKIERYIDKLGYEIAKIKAKEIENIEDEKIDLKIILEQNTFEYEESIRSAKIKNTNKKANEILEKAKKSDKKSIEDKNARIKAFSGVIKNKDTNQYSNGTCPYCGQSLGKDEEIDHILPRSYTLKYYGTVFNSEGNLLYVHTRCNQSKAEEIYKLSRIQTKIDQQWIENQIATIKGYKTFSVLTPEQQKAFKYALFLDNNNEAYKQVVKWLQTDQSNRVNGTQKYLAKKIQEKLKTMFPHKTFNFEFILADANDVHELRIKAYQLPEKPKDSKQETYSHAIDAVMSLVSVWNKVLPKTEKPTKEDVLKFVNVENWSALNNEFLTKGKSANQKIEEIIQTQDFSQKNMRQIFSKSIFGENALGERFKPIVIKNEEFYIGYPVKTKNGYDLDKCKQIENKNDKATIELIIKSELVSKNDKSKIVIYEIKKSLFSELSNQYFNLNYKNVIDSEKQQVAMLEYIIKNNKYYTKKVDVKFAPSYEKEIEEMKYPFYNEWKLFDEAWKHLKINENKKDFRDRYLIDKNQKNQSYQKQKGEYKINGDIAPLWDDFCRWYFLDRFQKDKDKDKKTIRKKARKTFSLVAEGVAQGTIFRLKRKKPNGFVYQVLPIDNKQIAGDYANILLYGNKKSISLVSREPKKELSKNLEIKESKDIRDIKIEPSKFFKDGFDSSGIEVILNKTSATIKKFPLDYFKKEFIQNLELFESELKSKSTIAFVKNSEDFGVVKTKLDAILKMTTRSDQNISEIIIEDNFIHFTLPFRNTSKLLDD